MSGWSCAGPTLNLRAWSERQRVKVIAHYHTNIGLGWIAYARIGDVIADVSMHRAQGPRQEGHRLQSSASRARLGRNDRFIAYLITYPSLSVYHSIVIYGRQRGHSARSTAKEKGRGGQLPRV